MISARKTKQLDATTMFTYSHANTALGQSERAYYLSYFIIQDTERPPCYTRHSLKGIFKRHCKHFQHLYFNGEFEKDFFLWFTNRNVTRTLGNCSNLVILDLSTNFHIKGISFVVNLLH